MTELFTSASHVENISPEQWKAIVQENPETLTLVYVSWCGFSRAFEKPYQDLSNLIAGTIPVVAIDAVKYKDFATEKGITGFPTIRLYFGSPTQFDTYQGERAVPAILSYLKSKGVIHIAPGLPSSEQPESFGHEQFDHENLAPRSHLPRQVPRQMNRQTFGINGQSPKEVEIGVTESECESRSPYPPESEQKIADAISTYVYSRAEQAWELYPSDDPSDERNRIQFLNDTRKVLLQLNFIYHTDKCEAAGGYPAETDSKLTYLEQRLSPNDSELSKLIDALRNIKQSNPSLNACSCLRLTKINTTMRNYLDEAETKRPPPQRPGQFRQRQPATRSTRAEPQRASQVQSVPQQAPTRTTQQVPSTRAQQPQRHVPPQSPAPRHVLPRAPAPVSLQPLVNIFRERVRILQDQRLPQVQVELTNLSTEVARLSSELEYLKRLQFVLQNTQRPFTVDDAKAVVSDFLPNEQRPAGMLGSEQARVTVMNLLQSFIRSPSTTSALALVTRLPSFLEERIRNLQPRVQTLQQQVQTLNQQYKRLRDEYQYLGKIITRLSTNPQLSTAELQQLQHVIRPDETRQYGGILGNTSGRQEALQILQTYKPLAYY